MNLWLRNLGVVRLKEQGKLHSDATFLSKGKAPFANRFDDAAANAAVAELIVRHFGSTNAAPVCDFKSYVDGTLELRCSLELRFVAAAHASVLLLNQLAELFWVYAVFPAPVRIGRILCAWRYESVGRFWGRSRASLCREAKCQRSAHKDNGT